VATGGRSSIGMLPSDEAPWQSVSLVIAELNGANFPNFQTCRNADVAICNMGKTSRSQVPTAEFEYGRPLSVGNSKADSSHVRLDMWWHFRDTGRTLKCTSESQKQPSTQLYTHVRLECRVAQNALCLRDSDQSSGKICVDDGASGSHVADQSISVSTHS
jgi:hypothetical protein